MFACGRRFSIVALLAVFLVGCASEGRNLPPLEAAEAGPYRLDTGDVVRVIVFGNEDLSGEYTVDGSGAISMPLLGAAQARGLTTQELEENLQTQLGQEILVDPSVSVQVINFRPFFILGEVQQPGQFAYVNDMTVLTAVALAGGFTYRAETDYVKVIRKVGDEAVERRAEPSSFILPGDVIYVYERRF